MSIQFSNVNTIWTSVLVEVLYRLGLTTAIICPGSRSAPLAVAFALHPAIEAIPILDERSAAFFAIGLARQTGKPAALVCTSGTAGANFYPAVIEAKESRIPLLVLTADRPPEMRECNAGQTIDQQKLYGTFPNWYSELTVPELDLNRLAYLRQTIIHAWERTLSPVAGVVHLNIPFRDPLAPTPQPEAQTFAGQFSSDFFASISPSLAPPFFHSANSLSPASLPISASSRGLIIAGLAQPQVPQSHCKAIATLAQTLQVPVLAEGLSPLRNYVNLNPDLISTYDLILRNSELADKLAPDWVIQVGELPTSKTLRQWLAQNQPQCWVIDPTDRNLDPLHGKTVHLRLAVEQMATFFSAPPSSAFSPSSYYKFWQMAEARMRQLIDQTLQRTTSLFEGKTAWLLSQHLPEGTPFFIANSMPVRDVEFFWQPGNRAIRPYFNRGANGIDGTLSTALGIAHHNQSTVLLTGDLALLYDTNGFLVSRHLTGHLTIVLINNQGGGIFESLPIASFDPPFEAFFATPQAIDFALLCRTYDAEYELIQSWQHLIDRLNPLPSSGIRVLEVQCDRKADAQIRRELFDRLSH